MSGDPHPLTSGYQIDAACDAFEEIWRAGGDPPCIEDFLDRVPELDRSQLFRELLAVDVEYRERRREELALHEVLQRFPQYAAEAIETWPAEKVAAGEPPRGSAGLLVGSRFGDFLILQPIGSGGMGAVYLARQQSVQRLVALKVIRSDRLEQPASGTSSSVIDRFRTEAQAAAQLDHPGIVTVYEVGEIEGRHYLAMRYIAGQSLSKMLQDGPLENRTAARYMLAVARAIAAAHAKGVLHRDLKPQNILVESASDLPWVADFGLAKLQQSAAPELTQFGDMLGTPQYMPPEQARDATSVTFAADVYSLGATLYHVVSGRPPFQAANAMETIQQVLRDEPIRPRRLNPGIDLDLETICLRALAKRPSERYLSAADLADDLQRYLDRVPIRARRSGGLEIAARWCQRNPVVAGLSATVLVSLLALLLASTVGYLTTSAARSASEAGFREARVALDSIVERVREEPRFAQPELDALRKEILLQALGYYQEFLNQRAADRSIGDEVARTYYNVGLIREELAASDEALVAYQRAEQMQQALTRSQPDDPRVWGDYGATLNSIGRVHAKRELWTPAAELFDRAVLARRRAVEVSEARGISTAGARRLLISSQMNLGIVWARRGRPAEALRYYHDAQRDRLQLLAQQPDAGEVRKDLGIGYYNMGRLAVESGDVDQAVVHFTAAQKELQGLLETAEDSDEIAYPLAVCSRLLGDLYEQYQPAKTAYESALVSLRELLDAEPDSRLYLQELAQLQMNLGQLEQDADDLPSATAALRNATEVLERLAAADPAIPGYRRELGVALLALGATHLAAGREADAEQCWQQAEDHFRQLAGESNDPEDQVHQIEAVDLLRRLRSRGGNQQADGC